MSRETTPDGRPVSTQPDLTSWGRYPQTRSHLLRPERIRDLAPVDGEFIARGAGRSYGDAALLTDGHVILTERLNRFVALDSEQGVVCAEAGTTLQELLQVIVHKGWFLPVTPGTSFCTLGGCLAADVHGKNHHRDGAFARHVVSFELVLPSGEIREVTPEDGDLFWATAGGMGLTGIIRHVTLRLQPIETSAIAARHNAADNLHQLIDLIDDPALGDQYSVAWIDLLARGPKLGRGVLITGHHATRAELPFKTTDPLAFKLPKQKSVPFNAPNWALNGFTVRMFNRVYYGMQARKRQYTTPLYPFFYPLDAVRHWNRMYGSRGFIQYQFVLPAETARDGLEAIIKDLSESGRASFLAVLKKMGESSPGPLGFAIPGYTLALDIALRDDTVAWAQGWDKQIAEWGGRVYLAKDSTLEPENFRSMYPRWEEFVRVKKEVDPDNRLTSDLARRLELTP